MNLYIVEIRVSDVDTDGKKHEWSETIKCWATNSGLAVKFVNDSRRKVTVYKFESIQTITLAQAYLPECNEWSC